MEAFHLYLFAFSLSLQLVTAVEKCGSGDEQMLTTREEWEMYGNCVPYNSSLLEEGTPCDAIYIQNVDYVYISDNRAFRDLEFFFYDVQLAAKALPEVCRYEILMIICQYYFPFCGNSTVFEPPISVCEDVCSYTHSLCPEIFEAIGQHLVDENSTSYGVTLINCSNPGEYLDPVPHCCSDLGIEIPSSGEDSPTLTAVVGIPVATVGVVTIVIVVFVVVVVVIRRRKQQKNGDTIMSPERSTNQGSTHYYGHTEQPRLMHFQPQLARVASAHIRKLTEEKLLITGRNISLMDTVGQGEFGVVYRGQLTGWRAAKEHGLVAVKTLKGVFSASELDNMVKESLKMVKFNHQNVMKLIGVCIEKGPSPYIVMPYMAYGSLLSYLKKHRAELTIANNDDIELVTATQKKLLSMCLQIAKGMEYLANQQFVHRDLAARNCMIDENFVIKVADFGLSEDIYARHYFRQGSEEEGGSPVKLPVRWMAIESLNDGIFTEKSDVWSFGVTVWEVFSLGKTPYPGVDPFALIKYLDKGGRLDKPANAACSEEIYAVVYKCWEEIPDNRPNFSKLVITFSSCLEDIAGYIDFLPAPLTKESPISGYGHLTPTQPQN